MDHNADNSGRTRWSNDLEEARGRGGLPHLEGSPNPRVWTVLLGQMACWAQRQERRQVKVSLRSLF